MAITSPLTGVASTLINAITYQAWGPLVSLCRNGTLSQLQSIRLGKLTLYETSAAKASASFGAEVDDLPVAVLHVHDEKFWVRLALFADMVRLQSNLLRESQRSTQAQKLSALIGFCGKLHARRSHFTRFDPIFPSTVAQ